MTSLVLLYKVLFYLGSVGLIALIFNILYDRQVEMNEEEESLDFDDEKVRKAIQEKEGPYKAHNTWQTPMDQAPVSEFDIDPQVSYREEEQSPITQERDVSKESQKQRIEKESNFNIWEDDEGI